MIFFFASGDSLPHNRAACVGILRTTLEGKKKNQQRKKKKEEAVFFFCEEALMDSQSALAELGVA